MVTLEQLNAQDPQAADVVAVIRAMLDEQSIVNRQVIAKQGHKGIVVSQLNMITKDDDARHVFLETVFGIKGGSSKTLTTGQCNVMTRWIGEGHAEKLVPLIVNAALKAAGQIALPGLTEKARQDCLSGKVGNPEAEMTELNEQLMKGETDMPHGHDERADAAENAAQEQSEPAEQVETPKRIDIDGLGEISPEVLEAFLKHRRAVAAMMPEAPASANVTIGWNGWNIMLTLRDVDETALWFRTTRMLAGLNKINAYPVNRHGDRMNVTNNSSQPSARPTPPATAPSAGPPPAPAGPPPAPSGPPPAPTGGNGGGEKIINAYKMVIGSTQSGAPKVQFFEGGHQYPDISWSFGGAKLLEVSPELVAAGCTADFLDAIGGEWVRNLHVIYVDSTKLNQRGNPYKNIIRVEVP